MTQSLFDEINTWQAQTFGPVKPTGILIKLIDEVQELHHEITGAPSGNDEKIREELADCFMVLMGAAASQGVTYHDLCDAIRRKHKINQSRTWGKPDHNGVINHIPANGLKTS